MNSLLTKLRISAALDAGKPLPASLRQKINADPELAHFACQTQALGTLLQYPPTVDPFLHDSIMRAVRASTQREQPRPAPVLSWLAAAATVAALAMVCLWMAIPRPAPRITAAPLGGLAQAVERAVTGALLP